MIASFLSYLFQDFTDFLQLDGPSCCFITEWSYVTWCQHQGKSGLGIFQEVQQMFSVTVTQTYETSVLEILKSKNLQTVSNTSFELLVKIHSVFCKISTIAEKEQFNIRGTIRETQPQHCAHAYIMAIIHLHTFCRSPLQINNEKWEIYYNWCSMDLVV